MNLLSYRDELEKRKANLQILEDIQEKQEDLEHCCDILRNDLTLILTMQDWRRTEHHTMQEAKLLNILHCLEEKQRQTC
ncbi:unnamed protein product [Porites evermanni]|uniref:Uncharacterized protein n=1 Tax=Porites evermanni TaxID=104178 RepID=A0ABN8T0X8_9CNID|nr:unnamed protein product [Porites evermanni]